MREQLVRPRCSAIFFRLVIKNFNPEMPCCLTVQDIRDRFDDTVDITVG